MDTKSESGLWLVVTGTGRCGTKFMNQVLWSVGMKATHQGIFRPGRGGPGSPEVDPALVELVTIEDVKMRVSTQKKGKWGWEAETSWLAAPYMTIPEMEDITKVHLVRHPKKVIDSLIKCQVFEFRKKYGLYYDFAYHFVPDMLNYSTQEERAAVFYVRWNQMIEPHADIFWKVENDARYLLDMLDIDYHGKEVFNDTTYNTRGGPHADVSLDDFDWDLRSELLEVSDRYGYEWPCL